MRLSWQDHVLKDFGFAPKRIVLEYGLSKAPLMAMIGIFSFDRSTLEAAAVVPGGTQRGIQCRGFGC
jgi:hypothetical protein